MFFVGAIDGGDQPSVPGTPTATNGQNATSTITFDPPTYTGKGAISYIVVSTPGSISVTGDSPVVVNGLTNGVSYTFTVTAVTDYGIYSQTSAASAAITPVAPPPPPPPPTPPPNPCAGCPAAGTFIGTNCAPGTYTLQYVYADGCCGEYAEPSQSVPNSSACGYSPPPPPAPGCTTCLYPVTGQETIPCECRELPSGRFYQYSKIRTYYAQACSPAGCVGCSCPTYSDQKCTFVNYC